MGARHLAAHEGQGLAGHAGEPQAGGQAVRRGVERRELRVVVEHLLEVRHQPLRVRRVAVEPPRELVVEAPAGHVVEGRHQHLARLGVSPFRTLEQEEQVGGRRELGGA